MGQMRFLVPRSNRILESTLQRAYLAGIDHVPWPTDVHWDGRVLIVERDVRESGNLHIPWIVEGLGEFTLSTSSLMERRQPYHLPVELARGTLYRLRNQVAAWQLQQIELSADATEKIHAAEHAFVGAATAQSDPVAAADLADEALRLTIEAIQEAIADFSRSALAMRHAHTPQLTTLLASTTGDEVIEGRHAKWLEAGFNTASIPFNWRHVQPTAAEWNWQVHDQQLAWCQEHGLKIIAGPLVRPCTRWLPDWLDVRSLEFDELQRALVSYVESVVLHCQGKVHVWHVSAGMNVEPTIRLSEEERLRLTVASLDTVRRCDPRTPMIVSFDQPWGEFMGRRHVELSPLHFADMLVRSNLGVSGLGLEINLGYWPQGTWPRDLCEIGRQIDQWSTLGLPLVVLLTIPSDQLPDPLAGELARPLSQLGPTGPSREGQKHIVEALLPFLLAKQAVHGIVWNQWRDDRPHDFAHAGLFDAEGQRKPVVEALTDIRRQHLM